MAKDYDVFLADSSISRLAGNHLGKEFYKRRKVPMAVDLTKTKGLQADLDKLAKSTQVCKKFQIFKQFLRIFLNQVIVTPRGANMNIAFGHSKMSDKELHANLKKLVGQFNTCIPRGQANVKSVTLQVSLNKINKFLKLQIRELAPLRFPFTEMMQSIQKWTS